MTQFRSLFDVQRFVDSILSQERQGFHTNHVEFDRNNSYWAKTYVMSLMSPVELGGAHDNDACRLRVLLDHGVPMSGEGLFYKRPTPLVVLAARHGRREFVDLFLTKFRDEVTPGDAAEAAAAASYAGFLDICCCIVVDMKADPTVLDDVGYSAAGHFGRDCFVLSEDDRQNGTQSILQTWSLTRPLRCQMPPSVLKSRVKDDWDLFYACFTQNLVRVKELVCRDVTAVNRYARGAYITACRSAEPFLRISGDGSIVGARLNYTFSRCEGLTPLGIAASGAESLDIVTFLVDQGADVDAPSLHDGPTPVLRAAFYGQRAVVLFLTSLGADLAAVSRTDGYDDDTERGVFGHYGRDRYPPLTPAEVAIDLQIIRRAWWNSPRESQRQWRFLRSVDFLDLAEWPDADDVDRRVGLSMAWELVHSGIDVNCREKGSLFSALHHLADRENIPTITTTDGVTVTELFKEIVRRGADINALDSLGDTPFYYACLHRNVGMCLLLIANRADVRLSYALNAWDGNRYQDDVPEGYDEEFDEDLKTVIAAWKHGPHPDMCWERRMAFAQFLVGSHIIPFGERQPLLIGGPIWKVFSYLPLAGEIAKFL